MDHCSPQSVLKFPRFYEHGSWVMFIYAMDQALIRRVAGEDVLAASVSSSEFRIRTERRRRCYLSVLFSSGFAESTDKGFAYEGAVK
jgi:hypothetical protein